MGQNGLICKLKITYKTTYKTIYIPIIIIIDATEWSA